jgi:hypothetical protein
MLLVSMDGDLNITLPQSGFVQQGIQTAKYSLLALRAV